MPYFLFTRHRLDFESNPLRTTTENFKAEGNQAIMATTKRLGIAAALVLGVSLFLGSAEAKTKANPVIEVRVPYAFQLNNRTLPAGNYKFELATGTPDASDAVSVLIVRNRDAHIYQAVAVRPGAGLPEESRAVFGNGEQHVLMTIWKDGDRFDLQRARFEADDTDNLQGTDQVIAQSSQPTER
jgi:hypothetical protein